MAEEGEKVEKEDEDRRLARRTDDWFASPFKEMDSIFEDLDRTLNRFFGRPGRTSKREGIVPSMRSPMTDLRDLGDEYRLKSEIPGLDKDDIEIELRDDNIVIEGERTEEKEEEDEGYLRRERGYRSFYRELPLPNEVKADEINASLDNGILTVDMPKKEPEKKEGKKIEIK
ncbi:MAG: Hsp20/alpha crystallin family protein [Candidatus Thermoplasmatota archaeon]|nr:Hsp20/alpha crystallin family protein [Candidatus Thermoplasmatota archaeon]